MKAISTGNNYMIYDDTLKSYDKLPAQVYIVSFNKMSGFSLNKYSDINIKETKVYGIHNDKVNKVLGSFEKFSRSLGVILSGDKGIGKSLFAKMISVESIKRGLPVIIVDQYIHGIASYIEKIDQEIVVLFDEFDKTFPQKKDDDGAQTEMLSLFDGVSQGKKLYVITCNNLNSLSEFLVNRPGRFHYHFRFSYPTPEEIIIYLKDKIETQYYNEDEAKKIVSFSQKVKLNYDCLRAIVFEINLGNTFSEAIKDLNIINMDASERYRILVEYENGTIVRGGEEFINFFTDNNTETWLDGCLNIVYCASKAVLDEKICANVINKDDFEFFYDEDEMYEEKVNKMKVSEPKRIIFAKSKVRDLHYIV